MKPSIPSGTRDFSPEEVYKRQFIFNTIRGVFEKYGYQPIETPTMEKIETLMGKYGEEGDKLIFKIFPRGEKLRPLFKVLSLTSEIVNEEIGNDLKEKSSPGNLSPQTLEQMSLVLAREITEEALRYDLTVPFARYVVMHQNEITFPFKRYQIQSVFRADRPQRGRYREFFQCDADVVGSDSLLNEVELIQIYDEVFSKFGMNVIIYLNNRKILAGVAEGIGAPDKVLDIAIAIDKFDKIGADGVVKELKTKNFTEEQISTIYELILMRSNSIVFTGKDQKGDSNFNNLNFIKQHPDFQNIQVLQEGISECEFIFSTLYSLGFNNGRIKFELTLARGLNYYTGAIIEVIPNNIKMGSVGGGGRYDDLTGVFGLKGVSGVGISFGADRIYDVMEELKLFPENATAVTRILFVSNSKTAERHSLTYVRKVRDANIPAELYPFEEGKKDPKHIKYALAKKIPFVAFVDEGGDMKVRDMSTRDQQTKTIEEIIQQLK